MNSVVEFSRPVVAGSLPNRGRRLEITATEAECLALARRFDIPAIESLAASLRLVPVGGGGVRVGGHLRARVVQVCVVALEPFAQEVEAPVAVTFVPRAELEDDEEGTIDPEEDDEEAYDGERFDVGEMIAQTLSLALAPWPRNPASELPPEAQAHQPGADEAGSAEAEPARSSGPFAALARRQR